MTKTYMTKPRLTPYSVEESCLRPGTRLGCTLLPLLLWLKTKTKQQQENNGSGSSFFFFFLRYNRNSVYFVFFCSIHFLAQQRRSPALVGCDHLKCMNRSCRKGGVFGIIQENAMVLSWLGWRKCSHTEIFQDSGQLPRTISLVNGPSLAKTTADNLQKPNGA